MAVDMKDLLNDQLGAITNIHQGNVTTVAKAQDYQYLRSLDSAAHALAWRELQSDPNQANLTGMLALLKAFDKAS